MSLTSLTINYFIIHAVALICVFVGTCHPLLLSLHLVIYQKAAPSLDHLSTGVLSTSEHVFTTHQSHRGGYLVEETSKTSDRFGIFPQLCECCEVCFIFGLWLWPRKMFFLALWEIFFKIQVNIQPGNEAHILQCSQIVFMLTDLISDFQVCNGTFWLSCLIQFIYLPTVLTTSKLN